MEVAIARWSVEQHGGNQSQSKLGSPFELTA